MSDTDLSLVLNELSATRIEMTKAVKKIRQKNVMFAVLSVISIVLCAFYLTHAYLRFGGEVTPDLVAANVQTEFMSSLPKARTDLEKNLKDNAPKFVNNAFDQLQQMPMEKAAGLQADASAKIDEAVPQVQEQMYQSMKNALDQANKAAPVAANATDETKMIAALAAVSDVYSVETTKFINQVHNTYTAEAFQFTDYLAMLGRNQNLDKKDTLYREMFRDAFALVRDHSMNPTPGSPVDLTTLVKPVQ